MDAQRSLAYMRLVEMIDSIAPAKLHTDEQAQLRELADTLVFAREFDHEVGDALRKARDLRDRLVDCGRFSEELGNEMVLKVRACGPLPVGSSTARL